MSAAEAWPPSGSSSSFQVGNPALFSRTLNPVITQPIFSKYNNTPYFNVQTNTDTQLLTCFQRQRNRQRDPLNLILSNYHLVFEVGLKQPQYVFHHLISCLCFTSLFCQTVRKYSEDKMTSNYLKRVEAPTLLSASWCKVNRRPEKDQH